MTQTALIERVNLRLIVLTLQRTLSLNSPEFRLRCRLNSGEFSYEWTEGAQSY